MTKGLKTALLTAVVILSNVLGNLSLSWGLKRAGELGSALHFLQSFASPFVVLGIALLIFWTLARMALLSWADLSFVLPVTSLGYVLAALAGRFVLAEQVSATRWMGTLLIVGGTVLVARTAPRSSS